MGENGRKMGEKREKNGQKRAQILISQFSVKLSNGDRTRYSVNPALTPPPLHQVRHRTIGRMSLWHRNHDNGTGTRTTELPTARCDPHQILTHSDNLGRQALRQPGRSEKKQRPTSGLLELKSKETKRECRRKRRLRIDDWHLWK